MTAADVEPYVEDIRRFTAWYIRRKFGRKPLADEMQDALLNACQRAEKYEPRDGGISFLGYLIDMARYGLLRRWDERGRKDRGRRHKRLKPWHAVTMPAELVDPIDVTCLLDVLDDRQRRVIWARYWDKMTFHEISQEMGVSKERVRQIEAKGMRLMQRAVSDGRVRIEPA